MKYFMEKDHGVRCFSIGKKTFFFAKFYLFLNLCCRKSKILNLDFQTSTSEVVQNP